MDVTGGAGEGCELPRFEAKHREDLESPVHHPFQGSSPHQGPPSIASQPPQMRLLKFRFPKIQCFITSLSPGNAYNFGVWPVSGHTPIYIYMCVCDMISYWLYTPIYSSKYDHIFLDFVDFVDPHIPIFLWATMGFLKQATPKSSIFCWGRVPPMIPTSQISGSTLLLEPRPRGAPPPPSWANQGFQRRPGCASK